MKKIVLSQDDSTNVCKKIVLSQNDFLLISSFFSVECMMLDGNLTHMIVAHHAFSVKLLPSFSVMS